MTDEENKRQRHLAEMLIAECDGKVVQFRIYGKWDHDADISSVVFDNFNRWLDGTLQLRIKPEPREWWLCLQCNRRFELQVFRHSTCEGTPVHVIEVLND